MFLLVGTALAGCGQRQLDSLDTRDFSQPCEASCSKAFECSPASATYETVEDCIEECNDPTLEQWMPACADLTAAAWLCWGDMSCEEREVAVESPELSVCAAQIEAFSECIVSNTP